MHINVMREFFWTVPEVVVMLLLYFHTAVTVIIGLTGILMRVSRVRIHRHNLQFFAGPVNPYSCTSCYDLIELSSIRAERHIFFSLYSASVRETTILYI